VQGIGTRVVTVTISSLVEDMLSAYAEAIRNIPGGFSWAAGNLEALVHDFVTTRECFIYESRRKPAVGATFEAGPFGAALNVHIHYMSCLPTIDFNGLRNVTREGEQFVLRPVVSDAGTIATSVTTKFYLGPGEKPHGWLHWTAATQCFRGEVPSREASVYGSERLEAYTMPLELTARVTRSFPANTSMEQVFRCAMPLTVKRRPTACASDPEPVTSPPFARTAGSQRVNGDVLARAPVLRSSLRCSGRLEPPPPSPNDYTGKENESMDLKQLHMLLERKAQSPRRHSPLRLNSLTLAILHDATALTDPPMSVRNMEVRTLHGVQYDDDPSSDKENDGGRDSVKEDGHLERHDSFMSVNRAERKHRPKFDDGEHVRKALQSIDLDASKLTWRSAGPTSNGKERTLQTVDMGSTHISRRGTFESRSGSENADSDGVASPPARNITPPVSSFLGSPSPRKNWASGQEQRELRLRELCLQSENDLRGTWAGHAEGSKDAVKEKAPLSTDEWQAAIQRNFKEFEGIRWRALRIAMRRG